MGSVPGPVEVLSESAQTRVVRVLLPEGRSVVRKELLGSDAEERARHETEILRRLSGIANIVQLAADQPDARAIVLDDLRGVSLTRVTTPLECARVVQLMLELARAVAEMHQRGVVHRDINPGNILLADDERTPYLIDFALATTFAELRPEFTHPKEVVGTLPYLAPEQTGRTGRSVDRRADLYGLGATMYELATGRPPFGTGDPVRLIHDHLARAAVPPATVNPDVPPGLSKIIMHLLEKEPDNRYQTADGLAHDLERVRDGAEDLRVGEDDVPPRLTEPSRLVGRDHEIDVLRAAFEGAVAGESRGVAISGGSGVGKSALIDELRPIVTAADGWFASGKFDRYRRDPEHDGVGQAFRGLGRLLLAEPEDELAEIRRRLLGALGSNAGLAAAVLPEFATLLRVQPDPGDPDTAQVRARRNGVEILRAVASRKRPVVFVVDDVQWAGATPLGFLDQLLSGEEKVEGLLTVVAYRDTDIDADSPLAALVGRWQSQPGRPEHLRLTNLDQRDLTAMVAEVLHAPVGTVADLADSIFGLTRGNPYETFELLNGLRREGELWPTRSGWRWNPATLQRRLSQEKVTDLPQLRVAGMPIETRQLIEAMACLGGEVNLSVLECATGLSGTTVQERLGPALDEGLLAMVSARQAVRFHHDRLRDAVLSATDPDDLRALRLRLARRLAGRSELFAEAADQYLPVVDALTDPSERRHAATLLSKAAEQHMLIGESLPAERLLGAALRLTDDDPAVLIERYTMRHAALYRLGRLEEADEVYQNIIDLSREPYDRIDASRVQISSLTNRNRTDDAIKLGLDLLRQVGWPVPMPDEIEKEIDRELDWCARWVEETTEADDLRRPDVTDPVVLSAGALISQVTPACFFRDRVTMAWLALAAARIWAERGPTRTLVGAISHVPLVFMERRQTFRSGYRLTRRILAVGEERDFEPFLAQSRLLYSISICHWFKPLEEAVPESVAARESLIRAGDLQNASYTFLVAVYVPGLATTLDAYAAEVDAAMAFAERTGNAYMIGILQPYRWLVSSLRGDPTIDGSRMAEPLEAEPLAAANASIVRALRAAIFDDSAGLVEHSRTAFALRSAVEGTWAMWQAQLLRALALADRVRVAPEHSAELAELDGIVDWIAQRAADMPMNFRHMLTLVKAERAWAVGDFRTAIHAFDSAARDAAHRPWHQAYIVERQAKFMLAHGLDNAGWLLLGEAREAYRVWGAQAKVDQLDRAYPSLDIPAEPSAGRLTRRASITAGAIDMLGILDASRALSSATGVAALRAKVVEVLSAMTGATDVNLVVWHGEQHQWLAATDEGEGLAPIDQRHRAPTSVMRYVERTREPLIVSDATRDDRFARDPYFLGLNTCSLLAVPVLSRGALRAILLLENHLIRDAFPEERLEGVMLIAGQLAVSLDNALNYSSLERMVAERTRELARANDRLEQLSITDPLTGLANRRRLEESLRYEWQRARRTRAPLSVAMVDIDHFKQYNDLHGHRKGDRCLQRIANQLDRTVRETDLVARYGGEEFAVVMPDTSAAAAHDVAERIRLAVGELAEPLTPQQAVSVSAGVATMVDADRQSTDWLIERADAALYEAKRAGRNRVHSAEVD